MRKLIRALALISCVAWGTAQAGAIAGVGGFLCGKWLKERSAPRDANGGGGAQEYILLSWSQGYLSGMSMGYSNGDPKKMLAMPDGTALSSWLDEYCGEKPLNTLFEASSVLYYDMAKSQGKR